MGRTESGELQSALRARSWERLCGDKGGVESATRAAQPTEKGSTLTAFPHRLEVSEPGGATETNTTGARVAALSPGGPEKGRPGRSTGNGACLLSVEGGRLRDLALGLGTGGTHLR